MRMKAFCFVCLLLALLVPAYADSYVNMTLTGNGPDGKSVFDSSNTWNSEPISPYQAQIGSSYLLVFCLDIAVDTYVGKSYTYDVTTLATHDTTPLEDYKAAAV